MTTLHFPLRFLDAVRIEDDESAYYVVGLVPDWRRRTFTVWLMTAPDGIETFAPLCEVHRIDQADDQGRLAFLRAMRLTDPRKRTEAGFLTCTEPRSTP